MPHRGIRRPVYGGGPVRVGRPRGGRRFRVIQPEARLDPDEATVRSGRVVSERKIDSAYRYLDNLADNATSFSELDQLKDRNEAVFRRVRSTKWASVGEEKYKRCNEVIRKRYDRLREKESAIKIGGGVTASSGPTIGGGGVFEKRTSDMPKRLARPSGRGMMGYRPTAPPALDVFKSWGLPSPANVLLFKHTAKGFEPIHAKRFLQVLEFPATIEDISKVAKPWVIEYRPISITYGGLPLPASGTHRIPLMEALCLGTESRFNNENEFINALKKSVQALTYSESAETLRDLWQMKR